MKLLWRITIALGAAMLLLVARETVADVAMDFSGGDPNMAAMAVGALAVFCGMVIMGALSPGRPRKP